MYYFAYGSNLNQIQMKERCPDAILVGVAVLLNHHLDFTIYSKKRHCGCADIIPRQDSEIYGLLYQMTEADIMKMDEYEGHPIHYRRIPCEVHISNKKINAFTYEVVKKAPNLKPSQHYLGLIKDAAQQHNFPESYKVMLNSFETID